MCARMDWSGSKKKNDEQLNQNWIFSYQSNKKTIEGWSRFSRRCCCCILEIQIAMYTSINDGKKIFLHKNLFDVIFDMWLDNKDDDEGRRKKNLNNNWVKNILKKKRGAKKFDARYIYNMEQFVVAKYIQNIFCQFYFRVPSSFWCFDCQRQTYNKRITRFFLFAKKKKYERNLLSRVFFI